MLQQDPTEVDALPGLEKAVLLAVTGYTSEADVRRTRDAGFDHHLAKPVERKVLQKLLASLA